MLISWPKINSFMDACPTGIRYIYERADTSQMPNLLTETVRMKVKLVVVLNREMKARSLTVTKLSRLANIPRSTLFDWSEGRLPSSRNLHYLAKLSNFFKISLNELLFDTKDQINCEEVLFSALFKDGLTNYKLLVVKINDGEKE